MSDDQEANDTNSAPGHWRAVREREAAAEIATLREQLVEARHAADMHHSAFKTTRLMMIHTITELARIARKYKLKRKHETRIAAYEALLGISTRSKDGDS